MRRNFASSELADHALLSPVLPHVSAQPDGQSWQLDLPSWLQYELMKILMFEAIEAAWNTPFNRYAWIIQRDLENKTISYHTEVITKLGHTFSAVAKLLLHASEDEQTFGPKMSAFLWRPAIGS
ncbi:hypothetical protein G7Z17_g187 [Cylindrodendrum hubeiense]|uniref:Uncharacterized protein n=1 Tax=Cylindrodendrum hubeiense TaxID=595255 RepID=A0A9P5HHE1_9HYPO|nr:hypothetical protein G7Z17_g187 [Cylindrodendrum hubeiense]